MSRSKEKKICEEVKRKYKTTKSSYLSLIQCDHSIKFNQSDDGVDVSRRSRRIKMKKKKKNKPNKILDYNFDAL